MKPDRWQQVETIFQAALKRDPQSRAVFLDGACMDDEELRSEVESLLAAHDEAGSFIKSPAVEAAAELMAEQQNDSLAGRSIGPYKIVSRIGAGGMGEVYLAQDSRLGRRVALKLLPEYFIADKDRLIRFKQEARTASALNHPNIITIFEIGDVDTTHFIATEYIEGQTLRQVIAGKGLKLAEALDVAIQAASALAAAHQAGIVHRDIKSENIMVRPDGYVKVLDFGLVKLTQEQAMPISPEASTVVKVNTNPGVVMGTASYMSPEQARGQRVDARTDIWSLGVVLYEMIAGRVPFEGEATIDVIAAIVEKQPAPLARYAPDAPAQLQWIVSKALRKHKDERYQTIKEMVNDLRELKQELEVQARIEASLPPKPSSEASGAGVATASAQPLAAATVRDVALKTGDAAAKTTSSAEVIISEIKKHKAGAVIVLTVVLAVVGALGLLLYNYVQNRSGQPSEDAPSQTIKITPFPANGTINEGSISPDGKYVVYSLIDQAITGHSLWIRHLPTDSTVQIFPPSKNRYWGFVFTPDSNYFYYLSNFNGERPYSLNKLPVVGGTPKRVIADYKADVITLSPDGRQMAFMRFEDNEGSSSLIVANEDGTDERVLLSRSGQEWFGGAPAWSPDGKTIACFVASYADNSRFSLIAVAAENGSQKEISRTRWDTYGSLLWLPDGSGLVITARESRTAPRQLWGVSYPDGEARKLTSDLSDYWMNGLTADAKTLFGYQTRQNIDIYTMPLGATGDKPARVTFSKTDAVGAWTPDGKIIFISTANNNYSIWVMNADGSDRRQLTSGSNDMWPAASPDGRYVVFTSFRSGAINLWRVDIDGGNLRQLTSHGSEDSVPRYTADGKWIVFQSWRSGNLTIWKMPAEGGEAVQLTTRAAYQPVPSPDGKQIACLDREAAKGVMRVLLLPIEGGEPTQVIELPPNSDNFLQWTPDGRALIYHHRKDGLRGVWKLPLAGGPPVLLTSYEREIDVSRTYVLSPDGKQWAITRTDSFYEFVLINNIK